MARIRVVSGDVVAAKCVGVLALAGEPPLAARVWNRPPAAPDVLSRGEMIQLHYWPLGCSSGGGFRHSSA